MTLHAQLGSVSWPEPPHHQPPQRTEPVFVPTVIASAPGECPDPDTHYSCTVVNGIRSAEWETVLRERFRAGYRLAHLVDDSGRTLLLFEHTHS